MSNNENRLPWRVAADVAHQICLSMKPFCDKLAVAGSLRRKKETVGDIEIVAIPKWIQEPDPTDLFQERKLDVNLLYREWANQQNLIRWIKTGKGDENGEAVEWEVKPGGRYWRGLLNELLYTPPIVGCKVDIFLTTPERWGVRYLLSTGSSEFNTEIVTHAKRIGYAFHEGHLWRTWKGDGEGTRIDTPDEATVFHELGLAFVKPHLRQGKDDVRPASLQQFEKDMQSDMQSEATQPDA